MTIINLIYWSLAVSSGIYMLLMLTLTMGWYRLKSAPKSNASTEILVSIVVAVRNEGKNIVKLLESIVMQDYPRDKIEIIIVNDHSTDNTVAEIGKYIFEKKVEISVIQDVVGEGKKNALKEGFSIANGELIMATDGDCELPAEWIKSYVSFYKLHKPVLIFGPVVYNNEKTLFQKLFSLDFMSLVASGAASSGNGLPFLGNGANLAFTNNAYQEIVGQLESEDYVSGDDVFIIHKMIEKFGAKKVQFLKNTSAIVSTQPPKTVEEFFNQRVRWASKAKGYKNSWAIIVSLSVFLFNMMIVVSLISGFFLDWFLAVFVLFIIFKFLLDFPLVYEFSGFAGKRKFLPLLFPFEFIYPFYVVFAAFSGFIGRFKWKDRENLK
jgi:cellulose synthase/poly-beta-1,6-N-acetylglucosamine synthase-like glycosyltransferase